VIRERACHVEPAGDADADWARSGAAWLSGHPDGPPLDAPCAVTSLVRSSIADLAAAATGWATDRQAVDGVDGPGLLAERAACAGLRRRGRLSCGGSTRLLECADGWIAVTLSRRDDLDAVPAWLGLLDLDPAAGELGIESNEWVTRFRRRDMGEIVEAGLLLGLAVSALGEQDESDAIRWVGLRRGAERRQRPLVVDLSALWAGPLCCGLLAEAGADVVKVESVHRPDGLRADTTGFFDLLNGAKRSVSLDLASARSVTALRQLVEAADVVVESSRPRALAQLGIDADELVATGGPTIWLSITAHGRAGHAGRRVGFGDDTAVAGGLVGWDRAMRPCFLGDALADPLTGIVAAGAVASAWAQGYSGLLDLGMSRVAASVADHRGAVPSPELDESVVARPRHRRIGQTAPAMGSHTTEVLGEYCHVEGHGD
jgi:hypothetical protein